MKTPKGITLGILILLVSILFSCSHYSHSAYRKKTRGHFAKKYRIAPHPDKIKKENVTRERSQDNIPQDGEAIVHADLPSVNEISSEDVVNLKTSPPQQSKSKTKSKKTKSKKPNPDSYVSEKEVETETSPGAINLHYKETMKQGQSYTITAEIFKQIEQALNQNSTESFQIPTSSVMKVSLSAPNFSIVKEPKDLRQFIEFNKPTKWEWIVTPLKSGKQSIEITASVCILVPGHGETFKEYQVLKKDVEVEVDPLLYAKDMVIENWKWGTAMLAIASFAMGYLNNKGYFKKKESAA